MPLKSGSSKAIISYNIRELIAAGHKPSQAIAIAYANARRTDRKKRKRPDAYLLRTPAIREPVGGIEGLMVDGTYVPPPEQGTARSHPGGESDPAAVAIGTAGILSAPDPNTPPTFIYPRSDRVRRDAAKRRGKRLPRQIPPTRIAEDYAKNLIKIIGRTRHAWAPVLRALPGLLESAHKERGDGLRLDAGESSKLQKLIDAAVAASRKAISQDEVHSLARKFAAQTSTYQRMQLTNQVRAALGADPVFKDKGLAARMDQFAHENVALVKRIPERLHGDLETLIHRAVNSARLHPALSKDIEDRFGVSERHARLIARDQTLKLYSSLNHARQKELGVERFTWRTMGDERVRDEHQELDGEVFPYDDPPDVDGEPTLPGEGIQCRCYAEGVYDDILEGEDEEENEGEEESGDEDTSEEE